MLHLQRANKSFVLFIGHVMPMAFSDWMSVTLNTRFGILAKQVYLLYFMVTYVFF